MRSGYRDLLKTGLFSDITLVCGETEFKVHKNILYTSSDVFNRMLGHEFKEATASRIILGDDPKVMNVLLHYIYKFYYAEAISSNVAKMSFTVEVFAIADKYDVPHLRELAATSLEGLLDPQADLEDYIAAIRLADEKVPSINGELGKVVIESIRKHMGFLKTTEQFQDLMVKLPGLMMALLGLLDESGKAGKATGGYESDEGAGWYGGGRRLG